MSGSPKSALEELEAMKSVIEALDGFDAEAASRILRWASTQSGGHLDPVESVTRKLHPTPAAQGPRSGGTEPAFTTIADLFATASPDNGPECALVVGYWIQVVGELPEFDAKALNDELKHLGRPLSNVTATLTSLITQRPALVMQTQKIGKGAQGRKRYKLTQPGIDRVRRMLAGSNTAENVD